MVTELEGFLFGLLGERSYDPFMIQYLERSQGVGIDVGVTESRNQPEVMGLSNLSDLEELFALSTL